MVAMRILLDRFKDFHLFSEISAMRSHLLAQKHTRNKPLDIDTPFVVLL
jgi:hypothetical protein